MKNKVEKYSKWYSDEQLNFDRALIKYRYLSIRKYFCGKDCLELGPADGVMTSMLINDFQSLDLVDGSKELLSLIPDYPNIKKYCSMFEDYEPNPKNKLYSTIIMEHVLEHIEHPVEVLKKVKTMLDVNGILIIGVPNAKSFHRLAAVKMGLLSSEFELNERDIKLGHYRVYDIESLTNDVLEAGFKVKDKGGVFLKFLSNSQIEKLLSPQIIDAFYGLSDDFKNNCAEIFIVASK